MLEERLLAEFADRLQGEIADRASELDLGTPLLKDTAMAEVILGYLEEAGLVSEHDLCPHEDSGRKRSRILGYSLPDDASRLELFTGRYVSPEEPATLGRSELGKLTGWAARFFAYAASDGHERYRRSEDTLAAARRIRSELDRIESVPVVVCSSWATAWPIPNGYRSTGAGHPASQEFSRRPGLGHQRPSTRLGGPRRRSREPSGP